jgi:hypothetical protein
LALPTAKQIKTGNPNKQRVQTITPTSPQEQFTGNPERTTYTRA